MGNLTETQGEQRCTQIVPEDLYEMERKSRGAFPCARRLVRTNRVVDATSVASELPSGLIFTRLKSRLRLISHANRRARRAFTNSPNEIGSALCHRCEPPAASLLAVLPCLGSRAPPAFRIRDRASQRGDPNVFAKNRTRIARWNRITDAQGSSIEGVRWARRPVRGRSVEKTKRSPDRPVMLDTLKHRGFMALFLFRRESPAQPSVR